MADQHESFAETTGTPARQTRRAMLAAALGGVVGLAAQALGRPTPARAGVDGDIAIGFNNSASATTELEISNGASSSIVFWANTAGSGQALRGTSGGDGVVGVSGGGSKSGVWGDNSGGGYGVSGSTGGGFAAGVWGSNSGSGIGVKASSASGNALQVVGKASFNRSGRASVAAGKKYVDVAVPGELGSSANVLATLQTHRSGVWVAACRRNYPTSGKIRIYLNKVASSTSSTAVAWFVFG